MHRMGKANWSNVRAIGPSLNKGIVAPTRFDLSSPAIFQPYATRRVDTTLNSDASSSKSRLLHLSREIPRPQRNGNTAAAGVPQCRVAEDTRRPAWIHIPDKDCAHTTANIVALICIPSPSCATFAECRFRLPTRSQSWRTKVAQSDQVATDERFTAILSLVSNAIRNS